MKLFTIAFAFAVAGAVLLTGGGCSSETDTKQPKAQGPVDKSLQRGPVSRPAPGGGAGTSPAAARRPPGALARTDPGPPRGPGPFAGDDPLGLPPAILPPGAARRRRMTGAMTPTPAPTLWNVPNLLSLSRLPLAVVLCACIAPRRGRRRWPCSRSPP